MEKIDLNNITLSYETKGKGSDVLLLHGFPSNMYMWNEIKNELIEKNLSQHVRRRKSKTNNITLTGPSMRKKTQLTPAGFKQL